MTTKPLTPKGRKLFRIHFDKRVEQFEEEISRLLRKVSDLEAELRTERLSKQAEARRGSWGNGAVRQ